MPIAQIVEEIDAYLSILRQARDLLSAPITGPSHLKHSVGGKQVTARTEPKLPGLSRKARNHAGKSRSIPQKHKEPKDDGRVTPMVALSAAQETAQPEPPPPITTTRVPSRDVNKDGLLPKTPTVLKARVRRTVVRAATSRRPKAGIKPAIALAGSAKPKIVVVSAEQLQREREQAAARPVAQRPRIPASGLSGKLAFEALFKNPSDPSSTSGE